MFERGKKEGGFLETADGSPAGSFSSQASAPQAGAAGRSQQGTAVIGRSIQINGDLRGDEDLRIEGDVSGTIELKNSSLTIGREGKIKADVYARAITVDGTMEGDLFASECVTIRMNARVVGSIVAPRVAIEDGAKFKGAIDMDQDVVDKALGSAKTGAAPKPVPSSVPTQAKADPKAASAGGAIKEPATH